MDTLGESTAPGAGQINQCMNYLTLDVILRNVMLDGASYNNLHMVSVWVRAVLTKYAADHMTELENNLIYHGERLTIRRAACETHYKVIIYRYHRAIYARKLSRTAYGICFIKEYHRGRYTLKYRTENPVAPTIEGILGAPLIKHAGQVDSVSYILQRSMRTRVYLRGISLVDPMCIGKMSWQSISLSHRTYWNIPAELAAIYAHIGLSEHLRGICNRTI
jgi:hypothetical protein